MENPYMINRSCWRTRRTEPSAGGPNGRGKQRAPGNPGGSPVPFRENRRYRAEGADSEDSLIIESNTVYEIDLECLKRHQRRKSDVSAANKAYGDRKDRRD